jgi:hypothetical protein
VSLTYGGTTLRTHKSGFRNPSIEGRYRHPELLATSLGGTPLVSSRARGPSLGSTES